MGLSLSRAGDIFLSYLGNELKIELDYKNHSGFLSCFILRSIKLKSPVFKVEDFDIAIGSQRATLEPDFAKMLSERLIVLKCFIEDASFLMLKEQISGDSETFKLLDENSKVLLSRLVEVLFSSIDTTLLIYEDRVRFSRLEADSADIRLSASGEITEDGDFDIDAKIFISGSMVQSLPVEVAGMLRSEKDGWMSYHLSLQASQNNPFLNLESDRFRIQFEQVETK